MQVRHFAFSGGLAMVLALAQGQVAAQTQTIDAKAKTTGQTWTAPRASDGHADLQGIWANNNATPMQRPRGWRRPANLLTDAEVAALRKKAAELYDGNGDTEFGDTYFETVWVALQNGETGPHKKGRNGQDPVKGFDAGTGDYSSAWLVGRDWDNRTSLVIDPPSGRVPEMTAAGKMAQAARKSYDEESKDGKRPDSYEDISLGVRCITFGSPRMGAGYNSYYQIVQTPETVAFQMEMAHDVRVIPLDGRPHLPSTVSTWMEATRAAIGKATRS